MNFGRWIDRIYSESDIGRGIATTVSGAAGLSAYLYWDDWAIGAFVAIIFFPAARILVSALHSYWSQSRKRSDDIVQMEELFEKLGSEEKAVIQAFVWHGGSVIAWRECNKSPEFSAVGIESLINRGLMHATVTADGMSEAFALDTRLFDHAQTVLPSVPF